MISQTDNILEKIQSKKSSKNNSINNSKRVSILPQLQNQSKTNFNAKQRGGSQTTKNSNKVNGNLSFPVLPKNSIMITQVPSNIYEENYQKSRSSIQEQQQFLQGSPQQKNSFLNSPSNLKSNISIRKSMMQLEQKYLKKNQVIIQKRKRNFQFNGVNKTHMFEGLPFVQYEVFIRSNQQMQKIILTDILKMTVEKANIFKSTIFDRKKLVKCFKNLESYNQVKLNQSLETLVGSLETLIFLYVHDFKNDELEVFGQDPSQLIKHRKYQSKLYQDLNKCQIKPDPLQIYRQYQEEQEQKEKELRKQSRILKQNQSQGQNLDLQIANIRNGEIKREEIKEQEKNDEQTENQKKNQKFLKYLVLPNEEEQALRDNLDLFDAFLELLKDLLEKFRSTLKLVKFKFKQDIQCMFLLKCSTFARYQMGEISETINLYEQNEKNKKNFERLFVGTNKSMSQQNNIENTYEDDERLMKTQNNSGKFTFNRSLSTKANSQITYLLEKYNFQKLKFQTKEAKVNLSDNDKKSLETLIMNEEAIMNNNSVVPDNRAKVKLQKWKNPQQEQDFKKALIIGRSLPNFKETLEILTV